MKIKNTLWSRPILYLPNCLTDWGCLLTILLGMFAVGYELWLGFSHSSADYKTIFTDASMPPVALVMTALAWRASRTVALDRRTRRAWRILTLAFLAYFVGDSVWFYYEIVLGVQPAVSWADLVYLSFYPLCLWGVLAFPMSQRGDQKRVIFGLDVATVMLGASMVVWHFLLQPIAAAEHSSRLEALITLAYPVGDMVLLLGIVVVVLRKPEAAVRRSLGILTLGIIVVTVADLGYGYQTLKGVYQGGNWPDKFYMASFFLIALSAQYQYWRATHRDLQAAAVQEKLPGDGKNVFSWLPYLGIALGYGVLGWECLTETAEQVDWPLDQLIIGAIGITGLVVARQITAVRENEGLLKERAARQSEVRFQSLVQNSSDVISILGKDGTVLFISPSLERVFGYRPEELLGRRMMDFLFPEDSKQTMDAFRAIVREPGKSVSVEMRARHRDQRWLDIEVMMTNLIDEPNVGGIVTNGRDVTERKKAEEALRDSEERLRQAQKMEAVGQLAGGVAHDFNNLLAVIIGYSDMVLRRLPEDDERTIRQVTEIKKAGDRATSLTRQLLAFSRKQVLQPKIMDLNAVVTDMDKMLRRLIGEHIEMRTSLKSEAGNVKADPGQIEQVLLNLAVNARDAMPDGGCLTIETKNVELDAGYTQTHREIEAGSYVMIAVSDTGTGITADLQSRVFEPFFTTKEKGKGTGLGLSTVHGIVKQSGGSIWIYSEVGHGTTFKIYLPRADELASALEPVASSSTGLSGTETILLVEDEEAVRQLAQEVLQLNGYRVLGARNGLEAITLATKHLGVIDLMVTDVVMPRLGGPELAEKLSVSRPKMRVLYMSGYTDDAIVHHGVLDGSVAFLEKPFAADALSLKVREVLAV